MSSYCPLCGVSDSSPSWLGSTEFLEAIYQYRNCLNCGSIYSEPMPDGDALSQMYGPDYQKFLSSEHAHGGNVGVQEVIRYLSQEKRGVFLDYACGAGRLLSAVSKVGWDVRGVEFDEDTVRKFSELHGLEIVSDLEQLGNDFRADVIHVGDVLEHLTDINVQFPKILDKLKRDGLLIAQGPLEGNMNLFARAIKVGRKLRGSPISHLPPYHVSLATTAGQKALFERFDLKEIEFRIFEYDHPASSSIRFADIRQPRAIALFLLRKLSQVTTALAAKSLGNRYFYVGRKSV